MKGSSATDLLAIAAAGYVYFQNQPVAGDDAAALSFKSNTQMLAIVVVVWASYRLQKGKL